MLERLVRAVSRATTHMVDLYATIVAAASVGRTGATQRQLWSRVRRKAPHSVALWGALTGASEVHELSRRQLVLQMSASSSAVLRGRWRPQPVAHSAQLSAHSVHRRTT